MTRQRRIYPNRRRRSRLKLRVAEQDLSRISSLYKRRSRCCIQPKVRRSESVALDDMVDSTLLGSALTLTLTQNEPPKSAGCGPDSPRPFDFKSRVVADALIFRRGLQNTAPIRSYLFRHSLAFDCAIQICNPEPFERTFAVQIALTIPHAVAKVLLNLLKFNSTSCLSGKAVFTLGLLNLLSYPKVKCT